MVCSCACEFFRTCRYTQVDLTLALDAQLVVRFRSTNKHLCRHCRGMVVVSIFEPSGPRIYLFRFFLPLPPLPMERPSFHDLSTPSNEFTDPSTSTPTNELNLDLIAMVRNRPFSGANNEDPHGHLIKFKRTCSSLSPLGMIQNSLRLKLFPLSLCLSQRGRSNGTL
jgi:hypothetical protein